MYRLLIIGIASMFIGCGSPYKRMKEIRISPEFDAGVIEAFIGAADDWCRADPALCFPVMIQRKGANIRPSKGKHCKKDGVTSRKEKFLLLPPRTAPVDVTVLGA